ncbi:hypothetical protein [Amycolatopsis sp. Hca4]|uniref:hypothetical protein n=1 Tax=Amycolatopsis sp. Hca4 TaxID=2742131 RepID=UPI0015918C4B|nr:hypothetical protein [Amycolatopsis sp. Hca4]QKV74955.1 hypothetical protein HUT10_15140 [Amycolatopsis sp. Hca4]
MLGAHPAGGHDQRAGRAHERLARAERGPAERLDRAPVAAGQVVERDLAKAAAMSDALADLRTLSAETDG